MYLRVGSTQSPFTDNVFIFSIKSLKRARLRLKMLITVEKITGKNLLVYTCIHLHLSQINKAYLTGVMGGPSGSSFLGDDRLL